MNSDWHFPKPQPDIPAENVWSQVLTRPNILAAWDKVRRNQGAPGVDSVGIRDLEPCFESEWSAVEAGLRHGTWQPRPVRRVSIAKEGGGERNLGIPTVMDRVVHQAIAQVITPPWEQRFSPHSFAYRRGLGIREALADLVAQAAALPGATACHLDIHQFFDSVSHEQALRVVRRIADEPPLLRSVDSVLKAGALDGARLIPTTVGIPQGSPLSPLLANGVLHNLDIWLAAEQLPFVRYADDVVILLPAGSPPDPWLEAVTTRLAHLDLRLNKEKTLHGSLSSLTFLGFSFFQDAAGAWHRRISPASWEAFHAELQRRDTLGWALSGNDAGLASDYLNSWLAHFGITECPHDQWKLSELRARYLSETCVVPPTKVRVPYNGGGSQSNRQDKTAHAHARGWWETLRLWGLRAVARRWVRMELDVGRGGRRFPFTGLRISLGPFSFRIRL